MKRVKHFLVILVLVAIPILIHKFSDEDQMDGLFMLSLVFLGFFVFNYMVRSEKWAKHYFTSKWNVFNIKYRSVNPYDIPSDLMFEKVKEVLIESGFTIKYADENTLEIMAISKLDMFSWGENIYIDLVSEGDETTMHFCSATLFQVYAWGRNEDNHSKLIKNIEKSLII